MAYIENEKEMKHKKSDYENDWAKDIKGEPIHINNAKSGLQGYYCLGCDQEMQGYKYKNPKYQSFFRHHAHNVDKDKTECVRASRVYRERLAEQILHLLKEIKAPTVYKYPPKRVEGIPMFLQESKTIKAFSVKSQLSFYEDEKGTILCGKNPEVEDRYLLIRPDITFFDEKKNPILFIEFVITHKLDSNKKLKLQRIGIDTVQIIIPKVPEEEIRKALKSVTKYKWVYNELEANTEYISVSKGDTERIPSINEEQRKLFEESYSCRATQINRLVRDIKKCLRSESYNRVERLFESELSRVAKNRKTAEQKLGELEEKHRVEALGRNRDIEKRLRTKQEEFKSNIEAAEQRLGDLEESNRRAAIDQNRGEEEKIESKHAELEGRYLDKNRKLEQGMRDYISAQNIGIPIKRIIEREEKIVWEYGEDAKRIEEKIREEFRGEIKFEDSEIKRLEEEQRNLDETVRAEIDTKISSTERSIENIGEQQERVENEIRGEFREENEFEDSEIERLESEESECEKTVRDEFHRELKESPFRLPRGIKTILDSQRLGNNFKKAKRKEEFYKGLEKFIKQKI